MEKVLRTILVRQAPGESVTNGITYAEAIMQRKVDMARAGNLAAIQSIEDRIDGKPSQRVEASMKLDVHAILDQIPASRIIDALASEDIQELEEKAGGVHAA